MAAGFVTLQAFRCERRQVALRVMNVVTRGTGHVGARTETPGAPQQPDLIPVYVRRRRPGIGKQKIVQALPRAERKRRPLQLPRARVAQRTHIQTPLPGRPCRIEDELAVPLAGMCGVILNVLPPVSMTLLAR